MPDMGVGEILSVGGPLLGSVIGADAAQSAADTQANAANAASQVQQNMFNTTQANLAPWLGSGQSALGSLNYLLGISPQTGGQTLAQISQGAAEGAAGQPSLQTGSFLRNATEADQYPVGTPLYQFPDGTVSNTPMRLAGAPGVAPPATQAPVQAQSQAAPTGPNFGSLVQPFTLDQFQQSPAYQFNLEQGKKALNQQAAARNMYYAPATLKKLADYSQGMASNEFQNAYSNYNTTQNQIFNRLFSLSGSGQNAAANLGSIGSQVAGQIGNNITGAGAAQAAGQVGMANALSGGMSGAYNNYLMQQILQQSQMPSNFYSAGNFGGADIGGYGANPY